MPIVKLRIPHELQTWPLDRKRRRPGSSRSVRPELHKSRTEFVWPQWFETCRVEWWLKKPSSLILAYNDWLLAGVNACQDWTPKFSKIFLRSEAKALQEWSREFGVAGIGGSDVHCHRRLEVTDCCPSTAVSGPIQGCRVTVVLLPSQLKLLNRIAKETLSLERKDGLLWCDCRYRAQWRLWVDIIKGRTFWEQLWTTSHSVFFNLSSWLRYGLSMSHTTQWTYWK